MGFGLGPCMPIHYRRKKDLITHQGGKAMKRLGLMLLGCLLIGVPAFALSLDTLPDYQDAGMRSLVRGTQKLQTGDFVNAIMDLRQAVRLRPDMPEAFHNLGFAFEKTGDNKNAVKAYEKALALNPNYPSALNNLGFLLATLEIDAQRAVQLCQRAVQLEPSSVNFRDSLGWACYKAGRHDDAISHFRAAIKADPTFFKSYFNLGFCKFTRKNYAEAASNFASAIRLNSEYLKAYLPLAVCYEKTGQNGKALYLYQQALTKASADSPVRRHIEREVKRLTQNNNAHYFSQMKQTQGSATLTDFLKRKLGAGGARFSKGRGINSLETSGTFPPVSTVNLSNTGLESGLAIGLPSQAPSFEQSSLPVRRLPTTVAPAERNLTVGDERQLEKSYSLAKSYMDRGLINEAGQELERIIATSGGSTVGRQARTLLLKVRKCQDEKNKDSARTHLDMGKDFFRSANYDMAEAEFQKALQLSPESATAYKDLALLHYNQGRFKDAYEECKKAIALDRTLKEAYIVLGSLYTKKGRIDEAIRTLRKIRDVSDSRDAVDELAERMIASLNSGS
ncbi:hypothetical protein AUK22_02425 [bacterium CG2_30_54_10]|nr:MAG: hypothetical protein AUK22_02425 [bacterium CG2_30_54_10]